MIVYTHIYIYTQLYNYIYTYTYIYIYIIYMYVRIYPCSPSFARMQTHKVNLVRLPHVSSSNSYESVLCQRL